MDVTDRKPELVEIDVGAVVPNARNPRAISEAGLAKLQASLSRFGSVAPVILQRGTDRVVAGHQRIKAAAAAGLTKVWAVRVDMDDRTAEEYLLADNRTGEEATWDVPLLADLIRELEAQTDADLRLALGFDQDELERIIKAASPEAPGAFPTPGEDTDFCCPSCGYTWSGAPK